MCSPPPECGPAAVAKVPLTTSAKPAADEDEREPAQLERDERGRPAVAKAERLDGEHDGSGQERDREEEVRRHDRPAEVGGDGEVAERRLRERAEEHEQARPGAPSPEARVSGARRAT